jgi:hypothetical protein
MNLVMRLTFLGMLALRTLVATVLHILPLRNLVTTITMTDDNSDYYDSDQSEPSDDKGSDRIICYSEIPIEHRKQTEYFINSKNSDFGGNDIR